MIFAFVLTIAYAIYYAVVIAKDLQGKKGRTNSTEEVFDLEGMEEEESVQVSESGDSFHVGSSGDTSADPIKSEEKMLPGSLPKSNRVKPKKRRIASSRPV